MSGRPAGGRAVLAAVLASGLALGGCTLPGGTGSNADGGGDGTAAESAGVDDGRPNPTPPGAPGEGEPGSNGADGGSNSATADGPPGAVSPELAAEIDGIIASWGGQAGLALAAPGASGSAEPQAAGDLMSDVAWSTSKVPIAIAVVRQSGGADANVTAAISVSDNAAAEAMWASLGDPATAAAATDQVLRDGGDATTNTNPERIRPEYTAFGQTQWALPDQAQFGANLTCLDGAGPVVDAMGAIAGDQRYGLGTIPGARFKGGWGPDQSGMYLVRQFGTIPVDGGELGVAIAARPADGTYETGQAMLTEIAAAVQRHMPAGGSC